MSVKHISSLPEFNGVLAAAGPKLVVVDFHATWCGPCHAIAPRFEQLAREYATRAVFLKVDVDEAEDVARHFSVSAMPTFHFHLRRALVEQMSGADPSALASTIARLAPNAAEVSFTGAGQRLAASGSPPASSNPQSARQIAAAAAARRMEAARAQRAAAAAAAAGPASPAKPRSSASGSASKSPAPAKQPAPAPAPAPAGGSGDQPAQNDPRLKVNETLLKQMTDEMGFPRVRAEKALILTGNSGLEAAVEWCFAHADDPDIDEPLQVVTSAGAPKPRLSADEAKQRADALMRRAREKREVEDKKDAVERERQRLRSGKEATLARQKLEEAERKRVVEEKRREKREALAERQRVREMLAADKQRRHERFNMAGPPPPQARAVAPPVSQPPSATAAAGKIQFRMPDGSRLEGEFEAEHTMGDLVKFIVAKRPDIGPQEIKLSQQYPRMVYSQGDYGRSLADLKLLPRGALTVSL